MFNQKIIQNENLIKYIEEKWEMVCKDKPHYVCVPKEDIYYYYNNNIIRIQKTIARSLDEMEDLRQAMLNTTYPEGIDPNLHAEIQEQLTSIKLEARKSELLECVQENLLSLSNKILTQLFNCEMFEKDKHKKIETIKELENRIQKEDVQNKTTSVMVNIETCINGFNTVTGLNDIKFKTKNRFSEMITKDGSRAYFNVDQDNIGIAHQVIDECREIYKILSGNDENNYTSISILFINREKRCGIYGMLRK